MTGQPMVLRHNALYGCGYVPLVIRWDTVNGYENASATLRKFTYATALRPWLHQSGDFDVLSSIFSPISQFLRFLFYSTILNF